MAKKSCGSARSRKCHPSEMMHNARGMQDHPEAQDSIFLGEMKYLRCELGHTERLMLCLKSIIFNLKLRQR